jgi:hypothetical protein
MPDAWIRFKQGVSRDLLRVRRASNFPGPQSRQLKRIIAGVISALVVLCIVEAVVEDVEAPQAPLPENILYYALSTIAQCAAALAAILGAFGLWRLDRLRELDRQEEDREDQIKLELLRVHHGQERETGLALLTTVGEERHLGLRLESIHARRQFFGDERRRLIDRLVAFLLGTLAILVLAIVGLAFVDTLCAWVGTMRMDIILASLSLGIGPALVILTATRQPRSLAALAVVLLPLTWAVSAEAAVPVRCTIYEEQTLSRLHTVCDDGMKAVSTWSLTLQRWQTTITTSHRKACTGLLNPKTGQVAVHCR